MERRWTIREEANAITVWAFRNGYIEELHAGKNSELLPGFSQITDAQMRKLNIEFATKMAEILEMRDADPDAYAKKIDHFLEYCRHWEK